MPTELCVLHPLRFEDTKARSIAIGSQRAHVEPSQAPVDEVLFSTMDDAPSKEPEVFKQPFPCMNESLHNRITEAIQTDDLNRVEKVGRNEHRPIASSSTGALQLKVTILKFLNGNIYSENEIIFHFVLATADSRYS